MGKYGPLWICAFLVLAALAYTLSQSQPASTTDPLEQIRQQEQEAPNSRR